MHVQCTSLFGTSDIKLRVKKIISCSCSETSFFTVSSVLLNFFCEIMKRFSRLLQSFNANMLQFGRPNCFEVVSLLIKLFKWDWLNSF